jgi:hypothetical protein
VEETAEPRPEQATAGRVADAGCRRPGWRVAVVPVLVAVVLSVAATLLLGGAFRSGAAGCGAAAARGAVRACCAPGATAPGNR